VSELQPEKLKSFLELKYGGIHDAIAELGDASSIGQLFSGFQKYLYQKEKSA
jgi:type I restriction enzyme, R subunit